jgi:guanine deaminase
MGGAKVLGLERIIGNFSVGKQADFLVLDAAKIDPLRNNKGRKGKEILSQVINRGDDMIVSATFVRGVKVYGNN